MSPVKFQLTFLSPTIVDGLLLSLILRYIVTFFHVPRLTFSRLVFCKQGRGSDFSINLFISLLLLTFVIAFFLVSSNNVHFISYYEMLFLLTFA